MDLFFILLDLTIYWRFGKISVIRANQGSVISNPATCSGDVGIQKYAEATFKTKYYAYYTWKFAKYLGNIMEFCHCGKVEKCLSLHVSVCQIAGKRNFAIIHEK